jgi:hypothetical protein
MEARKASGGGHLLMSSSHSVILGLDPRIEPGGALNLADVAQADNLMLGSSPRMTAGGSANGVGQRKAPRRRTGRG